MEEFYRIRRLPPYVFEQVNRAKAAARNAGANRARGTFLAFTDDDCMPKVDWLQKLAARFVKTPDDVIGGRTLNALPDNPYSTASQILIDYLYTYYNPTFNRACFLTSNNLAVPAARFRALGGFDTSFPLAAAEDRDFCDRWRHRGYRMIYAPEVLVYHAHTLTLRTFVRQHFRYGRGALHFHHARIQRGQNRIRLEPTRFYVNLLRHRSSQAQHRNALLPAALLFVSQVANAAGFFWERGAKRTENKPFRVREILR